MDNLKQYKNIIFSFIIVLLVLVGWFVYLQVDRSGKYKIDLTTAPANATITINNYPIRSGIHYLAPGKYDITVTSDGFSTAKKELVVTDKNVSFGVNLIPESDKAKQIATDNSNQYSEDFNELNEIDPMLIKLPYRNLMYSITNKNGSNKTPVELDIIAIKGYRNTPIEYIKRLGIDVSNYSYTFNYESPF